MIKLINFGNTYLRQRLSRCMVSRYGMQFTSAFSLNGSASISYFTSISSRNTSIYKRCLCTNSSESNDSINRIQFDSQQTVDKYFLQNVTEYKKSQILAILNATGKQKNNIRIEHHLNKLNLYLRNTNELFLTSDICRVMYGLRHQNI